MILNEHYLNQSKPVLVALSGGADSMALVVSLVNRGYNVLAAHFNHRWSPKEDQDAEFVRDFCLKNNIKHVIEYCMEDLGRSETKSRQSRYEFLANTAKDFGITQIAVGHHMDDQAETVLFRMIRGTGVEGLAGMDDASSFDVIKDYPISLVRPLLSTRKADIIRYCKDNNIHWIEDESNKDVTKARNLIRLVIMPLIERINKNVVVNIARLASLAAENRELRKQVTNYVINSIAMDSINGGTGNSINRAAYNRLNNIERPMALRCAIPYASKESIDRADQAIREGKDLDLKGGYRIEVLRDKVYIYKKSLVVA